MSERLINRELPVARGPEAAAFQRTMQVNFGPGTHNHSRWEAAVARDEIAKRIVPFHYYGKWGLPNLVSLSQRTGYLDLVDRQLVLPEEGLCVGFAELEGKFACGTPTLVRSTIPCFMWGRVPAGEGAEGAEAIYMKITVTPIRTSIPNFVDIAPLVFTVSGGAMVLGQLRNFRRSVAWAAGEFAWTDIGLPLILWVLGRQVGRDAGLQLARSFRGEDSEVDESVGRAIGTLVGYVMTLVLVDISSHWRYNETSHVQMLLPDCLDCGSRRKQATVSMQLRQFNHESRRNIERSASTEEETVTFDYGPAGMRIRDGRVAEVERGGPAHHRGVSVGWTTGALDDGDVHIPRSNYSVAFTRPRLLKLPVQYRLHRESRAIPLKHALLVREPGDECYRHILLLELSLYGTLNSCLGRRREFDDEPSCMDYLLNDHGGLSTMFLVDVEDEATGAHIATIEIHPIDAKVGSRPPNQDLVEEIDAQLMDLNNIMSRLPQGQPRGQRRFSRACFPCRMCYRFRIVVYFLLTWLVWLVPEFVYDHLPVSVHGPLVGLLPCIVSAVASLLVDQFCRFRDIYLQPNVPSPTPRT